MNGYLLDTCAFLWLLFEPAKLSQRVREIAEDARYTLFLSTISALEIAILKSLGRATGFQNVRLELPLVREAAQVESLRHSEEAALTLASLPLVHRDPFDRALIAQAITEGMPVLTPDKQFSEYPVRIEW